MMVSHKEVAEAWNNGSAEKGSRMFTDGKVIYSHGHHFPIAVYTRGGQVLFNNDKYSVSTQKHQGIVLRELNGYNDIVYCNTREIKNYLDNPEDAVVIVREEKPTELSRVMEILREVCKGKGVKRFPMAKLTRQIESMIFMEAL
jgi:hypothetical protein